MSVIQIATDEEFGVELGKAGNKVVVVDYFATWCGPCTRVAPTFTQLSIKFKDSVFLKVDVDKCPETTSLHSISAMPTFHVYRAGTKLDELRGADPVALEKMVEKHCKGGGAAAAATDNGPLSGYVDLSTCIDKSRCECLNESDQHSFRSALSREEAGYLESDCDEQLLLTVAFMQPIRLHSLQVVGPDDGRAPKTIKLFINQTAIDFDGAERGSCVQELELTKDDVTDGSIIPLKYVKFQNVVSLTVFVKDNQGDEETTVMSYIGFVGQPREKSDMKDFKRVSGKEGESHG